MLTIATWQGLTSHPDDTRHVGEYLGRCAQTGDFIACCGPLGAGKTTLVQGLATGLGIDDAEYVRSPTFALIHEYRGRYPVYHFDFYRLSQCAEAYDIGFVDYLDEPGVVIVEWADRFPQLLPSKRLDIFLQPLSSGDHFIRLVAHDVIYARYLHVISEVFAKL
jgi:tRNA threonylcarbamoyladenosine biosynthesis protein TsaE